MIAKGEIEGVVLEIQPAFFSVVFGQRVVGIFQITPLGWVLARCAPTPGEVRQLSCYEMATTGMS